MNEPITPDIYRRNEQERHHLNRLAMRYEEKIRLLEELIRYQQIQIDEIVKCRTEIAFLKNPEPLIIQSKESA